MKKDLEMSKKYVKMILYNYKRILNNINNGLKRKFSVLAKNIEFKCMKLKLMKYKERKMPKSTKIAFSN
jgi:hypothetical protein